MKPLAGRRVLVTRPREQAAELVAGLEALGAEVRVVPTIAIAPPEAWGALDAALDRLDSYAWVAFTSVNAVDAFFGRMRARGLSALPPGLQLAAVGARTAEAMATQGFPAHLIAGEATAEQLAARLREQDLHGKRLLFPRGDRARETLTTLLREAGAVVEDPVAYRTIAGMDPEAASALRSELAQGRIHWIALTSPSTWSELLRAIAPDRVPPEVRLAAIGPATARSIRESGYEVGCEASDPGIPGLLRAFESQRRR